jgi:hypothetical protein
MGRRQGGVGEASRFASSGGQSEDASLTSCVKASGEIRLRFEGTTALRTKNNPCRPAEEQKTAKAADQLVGWGDLLQQDKGADAGDP